MDISESPKGSSRSASGAVHPWAEVWQNPGRILARLAFDIRLDSSSATARSEQDAPTLGMRPSAYHAAMTSPSQLS